VEGGHLRSEVHDDALHPLHLRCERVARGERGVGDGDAHVADLAGGGRGAEGGPDGVEGLRLQRLLGDGELQVVLAGQRDAGEGRDAVVVGGQRRVEAAVGVGARGDVGEGFCAER
jgi:hypothetical protein